MKWFAIITCVSYLFSHTCHAQTGNSEFTVHANGLIYTPEDMKILGRVVDSLNLRFKTCDLNRTYYSHPQNNMRFLHFSSKTNNLKQVINDVKEQKEYSHIVSTYADLIESKDSSELLIKVTGGKEIYYLSGTPVKGYDVVYYLKDSNFVNNSNWAFYYTGKQKYDSTYDLYCYYLPEPLAVQQIPDEYARLIQYVDCMIDTNATVILGEDDYDFDYKTPDYAAPVNDYLNAKMGLKKKNKLLTYEKVQYARQHLVNDQQFINLVKTACEECSNQKTGNLALESLAGIFISKTKELEMMRYRRVIGMCSMDASPRLHAQRIAKLAAETHSWDIFLRAHLDIMNDRFERMSDGSYAYGGRKTYLKELEELGLNVIDLMLGLTLRSQSVSGNHYHGTITRIGRALAESKDRQLFEQRIQPMLKDNRLDAFNRGLLTLLYESYKHYSKNEATDSN